MRVIIATIALATLLSGCAAGSSFQPMPVGTGSGPNALRRTPCAGGCGQVHQKAGLPEFLQTRRDDA